MRTTMRTLAMVMLCALVCACKGRETHGFSRSADAPADARLRLTVVLRPEDPNGIAKLHAAADAIGDPYSPRFRQFLDLEEVRALVHASPAGVAAVARAFADATVRVGPTGDVVFVEASVSVVGRVFGSSMGVYTRPHAQRPDVQMAVRTDSPIASLPESLRPWVRAVMGASDFPPVVSRLDGPGSAFPGENVTPSVLSKVFDISGWATGAGNVSVAVAEFEEAYFHPYDLVKFLAQNDLAPQTMARIMGKNDPSKGYLGECSLDVEFIVGTAQLAVSGGVPAWMWSLKSFDLVALAQEILSTSGAPHIVSISWGSAESSFPGSTTTAVNTEFAKLSALGFSLFCASGDQGSGSSGVFDCEFNPTFPATSPYCTAVGATYLTGTTTQTSVSFSGGGFSRVFGMPSWQASAVSGYLSSDAELPRTKYWNATGKAGRAVPDVASLGTNFQVVAANFTGPLSGTSAATPVVAAMAAGVAAVRAANGQDPRLGCINQALYASGPHVGVDITAGQSHASDFCGGHGWPAVQGWDAVSGWGTPVGSGFLGSGSP